MVILHFKYMFITLCIEQKHKNIHCQWFTQYFSRSFNMENVVSCIKIQFYKKCTNTMKHTVTVRCHGHEYSIKLTVSFKVNFWKRNKRKVNMILAESELITFEFGIMWKSWGSVFFMYVCFWKKSIVLTRVVFMWCSIIENILKYNLSFELAAAITPVFNVTWSFFKCFSIFW